MRLSAVAAALVFAAPLASAQSPGESRTFAGCGIYACATINVSYTSAVTAGRTVYTVFGDGAFTLLPPIVTGGYTQIVEGFFTGPFFSGQDYSDFAKLPAAVSLVGRAAGDVIPFRLVTDYGFTQPIVGVTGFVGPLVGPNGAYTGDRVNITLSAVPEPSTLALAGAGLLAVGGAAARRRRASTV